MHPPEDFSFSRCTVRYKSGRYDGYVYYPHPETKKRHFESASIIEIVSVYIPDIKYGDEVEVDLQLDEILINMRIK
jgi:hypothetical protein